MKHYLKLFMVSLCVGTSSFANITVKVTARQAKPSFNVATGSTVSLTYSELGETHTGTFLGKLVQPDGSLNKYMLLDENQSTIYLSDPIDTVLPRLTYQTVLRQYDQVDGTCTGYAIDHLMQQLHWSNFKGNGKLAETLSTEYGRTQLLVESVNNYYLALQHKHSIDGILEQFGTRFGFNCAKHVYTNVTEAQAYVEKHLATGMPMLISFWIGPNMVKSSLKAEDYESRQVSDDRLWVPRKVGERKSGGHSVVAVSEFVSKGRKKLLMLDSDWHEPRVWDLEDYLGGKVKIDEIEFYGCD